LKKKKVTSSPNAPSHKQNILEEKSNNRRGKGSGMGHQLIVKYFEKKKSSDNVWL
jgi:hypothetical protein